MVNAYERMEHTSGSKHNRRCIDGKITGCGKCVGYCKFRDHPGFLTQAQRCEHHCIDKNCRYYVPKPKRERDISDKKTASTLYRLATHMAEGMEALRIIKTRRENNVWKIGYVCVFGDYTFSDLEKRLQNEVGEPVYMERLNYSFDRCVELFLQ